MIEIPLSKQGFRHKGEYVTLVSDEDKDLAELSWQNSITPTGIYAKRGVLIDGKKCQIFLHRVILERILGRLPGVDELVDHIDGNGLNNQRDNLRVATPSQNNMNRKLQSNNTSGYKGVTWHKRNKKYTTTLRIDGKAIYLGYFDTAEDAKKARDEAALKYHKEFTRFE